MLLTLLLTSCGANLGNQSTKAIPNGAIDSGRSRQIPDDFIIVTSRNLRGYQEPEEEAKNQIAVEDIAKVAIKPVKKMFSSLSPKSVSKFINTSYNKFANRDKKKEKVTEDKVVETSEKGYINYGLWKNRVRRALSSTPDYLKKVASTSLGAWDKFTNWLRSSGKSEKEITPQVLTEYHGQLPDSNWESSSNDAGPDWDSDWNDPDDNEEEYLENNLGEEVEELINNSDDAYQWFVEVKRIIQTTNDPNIEREILPSVNDYKLYLHFAVKSGAPVSNVREEDLQNFLKWKDDQVRYLQDFMWYKLMRDFLENNPDYKKFVSVDEDTLKRYREFEDDEGIERNKIDIYNVHEFTEWEWLNYDDDTDDDDDGFDD